MIEICTEGVCVLIERLIIFTECFTKHLGVNWCKRIPVSFGTGYSINFVVPATADKRVSLSFGVVCVSMLLSLKFDFSVFPLIGSN